MICSNKYLVSIIVAIVLTISGCATTSEPLRVERKGKTYDVVAWSCYDIYDYYKSNMSLVAWYTPEDDEYGVIELGSDDRFRARHSRPGVQHKWSWGMYQVIIGADGTGYYYDFSGIKSFDEEVSPSEIYNCVKE